MTCKRLSVVIHGHFYQPPREDPWSGEVPAQPSAAPFHDWNERIERECYGPITATDVLDENGHVRRTLNTLEHLSFDFGPTLLLWLERHAPETYAAVLEADRSSCERLDGHGNALAMPFHHTILPLADARDRHTEIRWGIADFKRRFGREPEGMWLPETAVDAATLAALASDGIRFVVLAPHQVVRAPKHGLPGRVVTPEGEIAVFVYDGDLSHAVAFGDLVRDGVALADVLATPLSDTAERPYAADRPDTAERPAEVVRELRAIATDGETYGHHHKFADMGIAAALHHLATRSHVTVENFASFLAAHPPLDDVELVEPSSWSCAHGVERWRSACGCRADNSTESSQAWRAPLRDALTWLAGELHEVYQSEGADLLEGVWEARDAYGAVASVSADGADPSRAEAFLDGWMRPGRDGAARRRAAELLEMERDALRLFTSCAWFFDDVARVEPRQVLTYAVHALELAGEGAERIEAGFVDRLALARCNDPDDGTAADLLAKISKARGASGDHAGASPR